LKGGEMKEKREIRLATTKYYEGIKCPYSCELVLCHKCGKKPQIEGGDTIRIRCSCGLSTKEYYNWRNAAYNWNNNRYLSIEKDY
jgi:hypothetical protein